MGNLFLHLWCVNFLKRKAVLKNSTFPCFYFPKRPVSAAVSKFYSADFGLYLFYLHKVPEGDTSAADTRGAGGNTRNDYHTPPRGIRYSWQFMDAEESVHIRLEKVSEKDIGR